MGKSHAHYEDVLRHIREIHMTHFPDMKKLLVDLIGEVWDKWIHQKEDRNDALISIWNEYVTPNGRFSCFSLSDTRGVPNATPANQTIEIWHKHSVKRVFYGKLRQGTAVLLQDTLPRVLQMDGINMANDLPVEVITQEIHLEREVGIAC